MPNRAMKYVCLVYEFPFKALQEAVEQSDEDIFDVLPAVTCDPSYNTRQMAKLSKLELDVLSLQCMRSFVGSSPCSYTW